MVRPIRLEFVAADDEEADREEAAPRRRGLRPLADGELPPYDADAT